MTQLSQLLFVLSKWGARLPPRLLRAAAARLAAEAGELDGPGVCSLTSALVRWAAAARGAALCCRARALAGARV